MNENPQIKIILGEITGKNLAIHAYDKMIWTVRAGFLTLFFAGWGILLQSLVAEDSITNDRLTVVLIAMILVSLTLSIGGLIIDLNYVRRKFRVIYALDKLLSIIIRKGNNAFDNPLEFEELIQVSGDKADKNYRKVTGYPLARNAGFAIYLLPQLIGIIGLIGISLLS